MSFDNKIKVEFENLELYSYWPQIFKQLRLKDEEQSVDFGFKSAKLTANARLNRYRNILPYDHSRVKLTLNNTEKTDYINANFVECKQANRKYILCQGPLENTCGHFWQMIWEQNSKGIVMLNRLYEKEQLKCEMYYPNIDEINNKQVLEFGKFKLTYLSENKFDEYLIRFIECENLELNEKRQINQFHFTNWPDFGEPNEPTNFLKFLNECIKMDIFNASSYGPPVIHCSAGVGRSGTFILIDSAIQMFQKNLQLNVCQLLVEFRSYRMGLVQTWQQLRFAYVAILEFIEKFQKESSCSSQEKLKDQELKISVSTKKNSSPKKQTRSPEKNEDVDMLEKNSKRIRRNSAEDREVGQDENKKDNVKLIAKTSKNESKRKSKNSLGQGEQTDKGNKIEIDSIDLKISNEIQENEDNQEIGCNLISNVNQTEETINSEVKNDCSAGFLSQMYPKMCTIN